MTKQIISEYPFPIMPDLKIISDKTSDRQYLRSSLIHFLWRIFLHLCLRDLSCLRVIFYCLAGRLRNFELELQGVPVEEKLDFLLCIF